MKRAYWHRGGDFMRTDKGACGFRGSTKDWIWRADVVAFLDRRMGEGRPVRNMRTIGRIWPGMSFRTVEGRIHYMRNEGRIAKSIVPAGTEPTCPVGHQVHKMATEAIRKAHPLKPRHIYPLAPDGVYRSSWVDRNLWRLECQGVIVRAWVPLRYPDGFEPEWGLANGRHHCVGLTV